MSDGPFTPDVVAAILRHMNEDHAADSLVMVRALGRQPAAESATMTGVDADGADFIARVGTEDVPVRLLWGKRVTGRRQVREEVVRLFAEATARLDNDA